MGGRVASRVRNSPPPTPPPPSATQGKLLQLQRELIAAESSAQQSDLRCAMLEERLAELTSELEAAHRQAEYARTTADAHQKEASAVRCAGLRERWRAGSLLVLSMPQLAKPENLHTINPGSSKWRDIHTRLSATPRAS